MVPTIAQAANKDTDKKWSDLFRETHQEIKKPSTGPNLTHIEGKKLAREIIAEEDRQRNVMIHATEVYEEDLPANFEDEFKDLIVCGLKDKTLVESLVKVVCVGKPYVPAGGNPEKEYRLTLKATFATKEAAQEALRLRFNLNDKKNAYRDHYLSPDRSPSERKKLKELVEEKKRKIIEFPDKKWRITKFLKLVSFNENKADNS